MSFDKKLGKELVIKDFESLYEIGAGWDIDNKPQPAITELLNDKDFDSPILDIGCGYGINTMFFGAKGYDICGIDFIKKAISVAKRNCSYKNVSFILKDIFSMSSKFSKYKTILDVGLFHNLSAFKREKYIKNFSTYLLPGSYVYILGFDKKCCTNKVGPIGLSEEEVIKYFGQAFNIVFIKSTIYLTRFNGAVDAFFVKLHKAE